MIRTPSQPGLTGCMNVNRSTSSLSISSMHRVSSWINDNHLITDGPSEINKNLLELSRSNYSFSKQSRLSRSNSLRRWIQSIENDVDTTEIEDLKGNLNDKEHKVTKLTSNYTSPIPTAAAATALSQLQRGKSLTRNRSKLLLLRHSSSPKKWSNKRSSYSEKKPKFVRSRSFDFIRCSPSLKNIRKDLKHTYSLSRKLLPLMKQGGRLQQKSNLFETPTKKSAITTSLLSVSHNNTIMISPPLPPRCLRSSEKKCNLEGGNLITLMIPVLDCKDVTVSTKQEKNVMSSSSMNGLPSVQLKRRRIDEAVDFKDMYSQQWI